MESLMLVSVIGIWKYVHSEGSDEVKSARAKDITRTTSAHVTTTRGLADMSVRIRQREFRGVITGREMELRTIFRRFIKTVCTLDSTKCPRTKHTTLPRPLIAHSCPPPLALRSLLSAHHPGRRIVKGIHHLKSLARRRRDVLLRSKSKPPKNPPMSFEEAVKRRLHVPLQQVCPGKFAKKKKQQFSNPASKHRILV